MPIIDKLLLKISGGEYSLSDLFRRGGWPLCIKVLPALYGAGLVLFVIRFLPAEEFGKYGIAVAYISLYAVLPRGLWIIPLIAARARGEAGTFSGAALWLSLIFALIGGLGALLLLPQLGVDAHLPVIAAACLVCAVVKEIGFGYAQADGKYQLGFAIDAAYFLGSLLLFAILVFIPALRTAAAALSFNLIAFALAAFVAVTSYSAILTRPTIQNWKMLWNQGRWIGMLGFGEIYLQQGDVLLLGLLVRQPSVLAPYITARTLIRFHAVISQSISLLALPVASRLSASQELPRLWCKLKGVLRILLLFLVPFNIFLWFASPYLFPVVFGEKYLAAIPLFQVLLLATLLEPIYIILGNALVGAGNAQLVVIPLACAIAANTVANILFVPHFGISAAPVSIIGSYAVASLLVFAQSSRFLTQ